MSAVRLAVLLAMLSSAVPAADGPPPMAGAGILERDGRIDCSAVLIAADLVATAGHCVAGKVLEADGGEDRIVFRTGAYPGHPSVERAAARIMQHPLYLAGQVVGSRPLTADFAMIALESAVPETAARPIPMGDPVTVGERLLVASYPAGQGDRARERLCEAFEADGSLARLSCHVIPGESGAPVVRLTESGPRLAAMVVATSKAGRQPYALTIQARTRLLQLYAVWGLETP